MDLLANIGQADQLTSARTENRVLQSKVKELSVRIHELLAENQALKAEVELYRADYARSGVLLQNIGESKEELLCDKEVEGDDFITSGDGVFPSDPAVTLAQVNGSANPLCCAMNPDDSLLVTGGADGSLSLFKWGLALAPGEESSVKAVDDAVKIPCGAPPICCAFASVDSGRSFPVVAAGCMDGYVRLGYCGNDLDTSKSGIDRILLPKAASGTGINENGIKHGRYVKSVCWSPSEPILASASADGTIQLTRIGNGEGLHCDNFSEKVSMEVIQSVHFDSPVEAMCFLNEGNTLCCYVRGTSYLSYFDLKDGFKQKKCSLNGGCKNLRIVCLMFTLTSLCYDSAMMHIFSQPQDQYALMNTFHSQYCPSSLHPTVASILH
jgi:hypothetical protein